jgi:hypothetical protein
MMREHRTPSRPPRARRLCKVTLFVPEGCAEGLRQFARELRDRQYREPGSETPKWHPVGPTTDLMVNPESRTRCAVRDTGTDGAGRFQWSVTVLGQSHPVAAGHTAELARARSLAAVAFRAYVADWRELLEGRGDEG